MTNQFGFFVTCVGLKGHWNPCRDKVHQEKLTALRGFAGDTMFASSLPICWRFITHQHQLENCASTNQACILGRASPWGSGVVPWLPAWLCFSTTLSPLGQLPHCPACIYKIESVMVTPDTHFKEWRSPLKMSAQLQGPFGINQKLLSARVYLMHK